MLSQGWRRRCLSPGTPQTHGRGLVRLTLPLQGFCLSSSVPSGAGGHRAGWRHVNTLSLPQLFSSGHSKSTPWQAMNQSELFLLSCENVYNIENPACGFTLCIFSENLTGFPSRWRTVQPRGLSALGQSVPGGRPPSRPSVRGRLRVRAQRAQPYFLATLTL